MAQTKVASTRQPVNRFSAWSRPIEIPYEDDLIHHFEDDGTISHDPAYPDSDCPCHTEEDEQGDTTSQLAAAMSAYQDDFYSLSPAGNNTGGISLDRLVAARVLALVAW